LPDGRRAVSGSDDARLWDVSSGKELASLRPHLGGGIRALALGPDGRHVLFGTMNGAVWFARLPAVSMNDLAEDYEAAGKFDRAEPLRREVLAQQRKKSGPESTATASALARLSFTLLQQKKYADAEPLLRECLTIRTKHVPDDWRTFDTRSMLGAALSGQKKYAEAEPLLVQGYEGLKQREAKIPTGGKVCLTESLERLVGLYEAMGQKDKAAAWRKKLEEWKAGLKKPKP
jgi:hypothetical protein